MTPIGGTNEPRIFIEPHTVKDSVCLLDKQQSSMGLKCIVMCKWFRRSRIVMGNGCRILMGVLGNRERKPVHGMVGAGVCVL